MARLVASYAMDTFYPDLNFYSRNYWDSEFYDNVYETYAGRTYEDVFVVNGYDFNIDLNLFVGGRGFRFDSQGNIVGGTITGLSEQFFGGGEIFRIDGISLSATSFYNAALTYSNYDDRALIRQALSGNDQIFLSPYSDRVEAGTGSDLVRGYGGNDTLFGNAGSDVLIGGGGSDRLFGGSYGDRISGGGSNDLLKGGSGNDQLSGGAGYDTLVGGTGNDRIDGDRGNDRLIGNSGADHFVFNRGDGNDRIVDFQPNIDHIVIDSGATRFGDLDIYQSGNNTVIDFADVTITLIGVRPAQLDHGDFVFI